MAPTAPSSYQLLYIDPYFPDPNGPTDASVVVYGYTPSLGVGICGVLLFTIAGLLQARLLTQHSTWRFFSGTMSAGTLMEVVGYIFRIVSHSKDPYSAVYWVAQYFFIVMGPVFFSAGIYSVTAELIHSLDLNHATLLRPKRVLWVFIISDVISALLQAVNAAEVGVKYAHNEDPTNANRILLAGVCLQFISYSMFLILLGRTLLLKANKKSVTTVNRTFLVALVAAAVAVYLRTIMRLATTAEGLGTILSRHETIFTCFELLPMLVVVFIFSFWHPGKWPSVFSSPGPSGSSKSEQ